MRSRQQQDRYDAPRSWQHRGARKKQRPPGRERENDSSNQQHRRESDAQLAQSLDVLGAGGMHVRIFDVESP